MRHVKKEWSSVCNRSGQLLPGLKRQCLGQKRVGAMIGLEMRHGMLRSSGMILSIVQFAVVAAWSSKSSACYIFVESKIKGFGAERVGRAKMCFANVDGVVARLAQDCGERYISLFYSLIAQKLLKRTPLAASFSMFGVR